MHQTRRQLLKTAIATTAGIALGVPALRLLAQNSGHVKLADDLYIVRVPNEAAVVAYMSRDGVLLVDGGSAAGSTTILKAIASLPGGRGKIHTLFNTHWHPEQTGSNERLGKAGATIIAHENTRLWLTQNITFPWDHKKFKKLPNVAQPNKTFYDDGALNSGVRFGYLKDSPHTDGDIYVHFPDQNVLAVGDAVYGEGWPFIDWWTGGWLGGIVGALERIEVLTKTDTKIVPARGPVLTIADIAAQRAMYRTIFDRLAELIVTGHGPADAVEAKPAKEFEAQMGNSDDFIRRATKSMQVNFSPDS